MALPASRPAGWRSAFLTDAPWLASLVACLAHASAPAQTFLYRAPQGTIKDNCVVWHQGRYHLFAMYRLEQERADVDPGQWRHMWSAVSDDGVHWQDVGPVIRDAPFTLYAMRVWRIGDRFILNHGSFTDGRQDVLRFWESTDLRHWRYLGPEFDVRRPDGQRLDHMDVVSTQRDGKTSWYGYAAGGLLRSDDGVRWTWASDFAFTDDLGVRVVLEPGGCERIGERYYLLVGGFYPGSFSYSVATFIADSPAGPFRPDYPAFRLTGNGGRAMVALWAGYCRTPEALLISNYVVDPSGKWFWHAPLKRAVVDAAGHLRLGYWAANEAMKGTPVTVDPGRCRQVFPAGGSEVRVEASRITVETDPRPAVWWEVPREPQTVIAFMDPLLDPRQGFVIEGSLQVTSAPGADLVFPAIGLVLEQRGGTGTAIRFGTWGQTDIGPLTWTDEGARFDSREQIGFGCATVAGIPNGTDNRFRLLLRGDLCELYLNDLLVQTVAAVGVTGRLGFLVQDGRAAITALRAWAMDSGLQP